MARYGFHASGTRATLTTTHAVERGARHGRARRIPASSGVRSRLCRLHGRHAAATFSQECSPPRDRGMTWSIIARDAHSGRIGIAVATRFFAVGAVVPHIEADAGAVATQAFINPHYGSRGLELLRDGQSAQATIDELTRGDEGRRNRQLHMMDRAGRFAAYTGADCVAWCGHETRETFSVAGNMLAGSAVLAETIRAYEAQAALPFGRRLLAAMRAGASYRAGRAGRRAEPGGAAAAAGRASRPEASRS